MSSLFSQQFFTDICNCLIAVRSEICLFLLAFVLHHFLLGKFAPASKRSSKKEKVVNSSSYPAEVERDSTSFSKDPVQVLERSQASFDRGDHRSVLKCWSLGGLKSSGIIPAPHLAEIVESMQRFKKDSKSILADVTPYLERNAQASGMGYVNRFLEPLAKSLDIELVSGISKLLPKIGMRADAKTFEILIQMSFTTRSFGEISASVKQMEADGVVPTPRTIVMLLKTALQSQDLEQALRWYRTVTTPVEGQPVTASEAPAHIAVQLVELACRLHRLDAVLPDLESNKIPLTTDMLNVMLTECSRARSLDLSTRVETLASQLKIKGDGRTYQALVRNADADTRKVSGLLDDMASNNIRCTQEVCSAVLAACTQGRDVALADRLYQQLESDPRSHTSTLQALLRFYADVGQPEKACKIFDWHLAAEDVDQKIVLDARTERSLVSAALQCSREDLASAFMESAAADAPKHINVIRACANKGNLQEAMSFFRSLQAGSSEMSSSVWNAALDACVECRDLDQAVRFIKEIEEAGMADAVTYNTVIKAHLRNENLEAVRGIMKKMRKAGCAPNQVTYNELINALVRNERNPRNLQSAWEVVEEMKVDGVEPNRITCSILLKSLKAKASSADINRALGLTSQMSEPMDEVLMSSVIEACVRVGKQSLLAQKLKELHGQGGVTITGAQTFGSLIKAYGQVNDTAGAWRCWKEMRSRHIKPTSVTIGCMVEAIASSGDVDGAYELICQLLEDDQCKDQVNAVIFGSVLKGYGRSGRIERVWTVFHEMLSWNIQPSITTFNAVIDACARSARMDDVPKLRDDMKKRHIKPNLITYSTMMKGFSQSKNMPLALATLQELRRTPDLKPDGIVYNTLLEGCAQAGLAAEGERLFQDMQDEGVAPTNYTLSVMVRIIGQSRRADRAFDLVENITNRYRFRANSHVCNALIQACLTSRDLTRAMSVFDHMTNDHQVLDSRNRQQLVRGLIAVNKADSSKTLDAAKVLYKAVEYGVNQPKQSSEQQSSWGSQDDALLSEVLCELKVIGHEGANFARQLVAKARASGIRVNVA